jgi:hypothetical protein
LPELDNKAALKGGFAVLGERFSELLLMEARALCAKELL